MRREREQRTWRAIGNPELQPMQNFGIAGAQLEYYSVYSTSTLKRRRMHKKRDEPPDSNSKLRDVHGALTDMNQLQGLGARRRECARLHAQNTELIEELAALRRQVESHERKTKHSRTTKQNAALAGVAGGAAAHSEGQDSPPPSPNRGCPRNSIRLNTEYGSAWLHSALLSTSSRRRRRSCARCAWSAAARRFW